MDLPQDENYETLGGLIFHVTGEIPKKNTTLSINELEIKVVSVLSNKIEKVAIKKSNWLNFKQNQFHILFLIKKL